MKGELYHAAHPKHTYIRWAIFYAAILVVGVSVLVLAANRIRTYQIPSGSLELSVPYKKYLVGESVSFTLKNNYNSTVYVEDECPKEPLMVYYRSSDDWVRVHDTATTGSCSDKERRISIAPHSQRTANFNAWPHLFEKPGTYRIVAHVDYFDTAPYQDFEVIAKPAKAVVAPTPATPAKIVTTTTTSPTTTTTTSGGTSTPAATPVTPTLTDKTVTVAGGTIVVQYSSSTINVISITPATGCTKEGGRSGSTVEVQFNCRRSETTVKLSLVNGVLVVRTEN